MSAIDVGTPQAPSGAARDPEAIDFASPDAAQYAEHVEELGRRTPLEPLERLAYGPDRGQWLDVYAPPGARDLPILVFFHGGAWVNGHLGWLRFMAPIVTALPAVLVAGTYRLAPRCRWPAQYEDVRDALRTVRENARRFGGHLDRIVLAGHSAGGHLAALVVLKREVPPVRACFPVSSSFDLQYGDVPLDSHVGRVYRYLFSARAQDRDASPLEFVAGNRVPFHVVWGEHDLRHVVTSSRAMVQALEREGSPVTHTVLAGASHFDSHLALANPADPWYARLREVTA